SPTSSSVATSPSSPASPSRADPRLPGTNLVCQPSSAGVGRDVGRAAELDGVVALVAADARGGARFGRRASGEGRAVGRERDAEPEVVAGAGVGSLDVAALAPRRAAAREDVDGAGVASRAVALVAVDADAGAALERGADDERRGVGRERCALAEATAPVARLHVRLLGPRRAAAGEQVERTR